MDTNHISRSIQCTNDLKYRKIRCVFVYLFPFGFEMCDRVQKIGRFSFVQNLWTKRRDQEKVSNFFFALLNWWIKKRIERKVSINNDQNSEKNEIEEKKNEMQPKRIQSSHAVNSSSKRTWWWLRTHDAAAMRLPPLHQMPSDVIWIMV